MPKIIVAHYFQETNSFHPNPTTYENFGVTRGEDLIRDGRGVVNGAVDQFAKRAGCGNRADVRCGNGSRRHYHPRVFRANLQRMFGGDRGKQRRRGCAILLHARRDGG